MTPHIEDDLTDAQFEANMELLEVQVVQYVRTVGERLHLSETTQNACMKRALMDALLDMIEHEPCDLARGEIVEDLAGVWNRRVKAMLKQRIAGPTAH
jgi:hypothetical protein